MGIKSRIVLIDNSLGSHSGWELYNIFIYCCDGLLTKPTIIFGTQPQFHLKNRILNTPTSQRSIHLTLNRTHLSFFVKCEREEGGRFDSEVQPSVKVLGNEKTVVLVGHFLGLKLIFYRQFARTALSVATFVSLEFVFPFPRGCADARNTPCHHENQCLSVF